MKPCAFVRKCDMATVHTFEGVLLSVGISVHGHERFLAICIQDSLGGCQHLSTKGRGSMALIEGIAHALLLCGLQ